MYHSRRIAPELRVRVTAGRLHVKPRRRGSQAESRVPHIQHAAPARVRTRPERVKQVVYKIAGPVACLIRRTDDAAAGVDRQFVCAGAGEIGELKAAGRGVRVTIVDFKP